jgi:4-hydroxybenzoate polyprenyltransferase
LILFVKAWALIKSTHPIPSFSVTLLTVLFGLSYFLPFEHLALIGLCVLAQQFSVGLSNDWLDYDRDKSVNRQDKPAARGEVSSKLVRNSSITAGFIALALAFTFGWPSGLMMALMLAVGWSYNLGLKSNGFSVVPYAIGFGMLPVFVTLSFEQPQLPSWWVILAASLLGISAHFANALPDLLEDRKTGVRALPHILGQRVSALVIAGTAILATTIVVTQSPSLNFVIALTGFALTVGLALAASALALKSKPPRAIFHLLIAASFVNVVLLVLGQSNTAAI